MYNKQSILSFLLTGSILGTSILFNQSNAAAKAPVANRTITNRPVFSAKAPSEINKKAIREVHFKVTPAFDSPILAASNQPETISITGPAEATQEQMVNFINKRNAKPKLTCTVPEIVNYYYQEAGREGIRPDVALCQALKETGFFGYGGDVSPKQNNFCGLGATGNHEPGASFATAQLGVRAHIQHLLAYSSINRPQQTIIDPRYWHVVKNRPDLHGKVTNWTGLNGAWAVPGKNYGQEILRLWQEAQTPDASDVSLTAANQKLKQSPADPDAYIYRGIVFFKRQNYTAAQQDFSKALQLKPAFSASLYNLGLTFTKLGKPKAAIKAYDDLLKISPNYNQGWYNRGLLHFEKHDFTKAAADMNALLNLEPRSADAQNLLGVISVKQKRYPDAWNDFYKAAAINSANMTVLANQFIIEACLK